MTQFAGIAALDRILDALTRFDEEQPRYPAGTPGGVGGQWLGNNVVVSGLEALAVPPVSLDRLVAAGDARAAALWYRTGDNSLETGNGLPGFISLNRFLRGDGPSGVDPDMASRVADIDSVMSESRLPQAIEVVRGVDGQLVDILGGHGSLKGVEFTDRAFVSTTTDRAHADTFGSSLMRITVPEGTAAVRLADRDPDLVEAEILLDRDLRFKVLDEVVERNDFGWVERHEIIAEVVS